MFQYQFLPQIVVRTPSLPFNYLYEKLLNGSDTDQIENLKNYYKLPEVQEALFIASPSLYYKFLDWINEDNKTKDENEKIKLSLLRYLLRMHTRCTPFGLFAGCSVGEWSEKNEIVLKGIKNYERYTRLDMYYLCTLVQEIIKDPRIKLALRFYPNSTIYTAGDEIRFIEYTYFNDARIHQISSVEYNFYIDKLLNEAREGKKISELAVAIQDEEITYDEAFEFVETIIDSQILISELEPAITGPDFLEQIIQTLVDAKIDSITLNNILPLILDKLRHIDQKGLGIPIHNYQSLLELLKKFELSVDLGKIFHVDMIKPAISCTLDNKLTGSLKDAITLLNCLKTSSPETNLSKFREAFLERYETREMPLLQVLDTETGIGYLQVGQGVGDIAEIIEGIALPPKKTNSSVEWSEVETFLLSKYLEACSNNLYEIEIYDKEISKFNENWEGISDTFSVMFRLIEDNMQNPRIDISSIANGSAANLLGRFTQSDKKIDQLSRNITNHEKLLNQNKILAEIIHLPQSRVGNVLIRTQLRNYEIPFLGKASTEKEFQIELNDLFVSIKNQQIVLRSKKLNKEIIPKLSSAHNFSSDALPVYQFLCELQFQNIRPYLFFSWGVLEKHYIFLPRVSYKNVILYRATWSFKKEHIESLLKKWKEDKNLDLIRDWRAKWNIPQYIVLSEFDNELFIDLEKKLLIDVFIHKVENLSEFILKEFLFSKDNAIVKDNEGNIYTNEMIVSLLKQKEERLPVTVSKNVIQPESSDYQFAIGSEWLYYKVYTGIKTIDKFLITVIKPLAEELIKVNLIDEWFFVRYQDPKMHVRIRFHLTDTKRIADVIDKFYHATDPWLKENVIWKIQTDIYSREIDRYGKHTLNASETLFFNNSQTIVNYLSLLENHPDSDRLRWLFGMMLTENLLNQFEFSIDSKIDLVKFLRESHLSSITSNTAFVVKQLNKKYSNFKEVINQYLYQDNFHSPEKAMIIDILNADTQINNSIAKKIIQISNSSNAEISVIDLVSSYIHMHFNRLFRSFANQQELVLYDWLFRYYSSVKAKSSKTPTYQ